MEHEHKAALIIAIAVPSILVIGVCTTWRLQIKAYAPEIQLLKLFEVLEDS
jgi:hypothetical protein